jgi:hypothetical protein
VTIRSQYLQQEPSPAPAVSPAMVPEPSKDRLTVRQGEIASSSAVSSVSSSSAKATVRASRKSWNQYHAALMRRRRSAASLDAAELAFA